MDNQAQNNNETEIDLVELFMMLMSHILVIAAVTVAFAAAGFVGTKLFILEKYTAKTYLYVRNVDLGSEKISNADLSVSRSLVSTYIAILQNRAVIKEVADALPNRLNEEQMSRAFKLVDGKVPVDRLQSCISMNSDGNTEILVISAKTTDPLASAAICDTYNIIAPDYLIRMVGAGSVEAISAAEIPTSPSEPNVMKNTAIAGMLGFVLICGIYVLIFLFDHSVETEEDIKQFKVPFLGDIPEVHGAQGKKHTGRKDTLLDEESTLVPRDDNLIVYAHNLASGEMFGSLFRMGDRKYLDRDPFVTFSTLYEEDEYVPVAVLVTTVGQGSKDFHFMVKSFASEESFQTFVAAARERSKIQLNVDCRWGDKLLTLVTCNDEARTERLIVLLRRRREGEDAAALAKNL